ncbi:MAG TPA: type II toxin-antitoxin system VapB family antitoxin [Propylenella sp.]
MAFHIRDPETDRLARELARLQGDGITNAVRSALEAKLAEERRKVPLMERIKDITDEIAAAPKTGLKADKAYFDEMWGQGDD